MIMSTPLKDAVTGTGPTDSLERALTQLWMDTLQLAQIGVNDSFFALGGDSLAAKRMLSQIGRRFGVECALVEFYDADTIAGLTAILAVKINESADDAQFQEGTI
jgi:hypothetical protein